MAKNAINRQSINRHWRFSPLKTQSIKAGAHKNRKLPKASFKFSFCQNVSAKAALALAFQLFISLGL
jgi:hypothetical protein